MGSGGTEAHADGLTTRRVDPDMEQILASIRKIISDDQKALGLDLDDAAPLRAPPRRVRPGHPAQAQPSRLHPVEEPATSSSPARAATRSVAGAAPEPDEGPDDDMDLSLHRMTARARAPEVDTGLPPRPRPPVRLSAAPPVDYRPPEARAEPAPADPSPLVDQRLAGIIRRAVAGQVAEVIGAHAGGAWAAAPAGAAQAPWDGADLDADHPDLAEPGPVPTWPVPRGDARASGARLAPVPVDSSAMPHGREAIGVLVTPATAARISGAFDALTQRVAAERARTMEETVTDMLRPMLANWLETHLPEIVERLVAEQVARLSRGEPD